MPAFFKELTPYQRSDFQRKLGCSEIDCKKIIDELLELGFLKSDGKNFSFQFVGVFGVNSVIGCCFPKFFEDADMDICRFKKIVQVIRKCQHNRDNSYRYSYGEPINFFNQLSVELFLIKDYIENGVYSNYKSYIEDNGDGEIDWDRTINETFAIIKENRPYYTTMKTWATENDESDYFKRLHKYVLTLCFSKMKKEGLLELFGLPFDTLSEECEKDFGNIDYIKYRISQEIQTQYILRKQTLLKTLLSFFAKEKSCETNESLTVYGVNNFDYIWQEACAYIFNDKHSEYERIIDNLRKPLWFHYNDDSSAVLSKNNENTLRTDIISVYENEGKRTFCILDAKNYLIDWSSDRYKGQPGVEDVVKQFAYHKEFLGYIANAGYDHVVNALLFPYQEHFDPEGSNNMVNNFGYVEMPIMMDWGDEWLVPIHLIYLSPSFVLMNYLNNTRCMDQLQVIAHLNEDRANRAKNVLRRMLGTEDQELCCLLVQDKYVLSVSETNEKALYFVKTSGDIEYPLHSEMDDCTKLIGYSASGECFIADVRPSERVEVDYENLRNEIPERIFPAQTRFLFKMVLTSWKKMEGIRRSDLNRCRSDENWFIAGNDENEFLPSGSPKVIKISLV